MSLADDILNYLRYLHDEQGLYISIHKFKELKMINLDNGEFSNHINPYCIRIKSIKNMRNKCLECQERTIHKCNNNGSFTGICAYGVKEYIVPVSYHGEYRAFISVSGYKGRRNRVDKEAMDLYDKYLVEFPNTNIITTLIAPLKFMLEKFYEDTKIKDDNLYVKILNYISENPYNVSLEILSKKLNYSKSYISHIFKKNSGNTINHYCNILKINDAEQLLKNTNMSVTEVAETTGFNDVSYFIKLFREIKKTTPKKLRKIKQ